jgi:hypothetical protein
MVTSWPLLEIAGGTSRTFELRPNDRDEVEPRARLDPSVSNRVAEVPR